MARVVAALDDSAVATAVIAVAVQIAPLYGAQVEALHVSEGGHGTARETAAAAGVVLRLAQAPVRAAITRAVAEPDVAALVLGTRRTAGGRRPAGSIALELITTVTKPLVLVPPDVPRGYRLDTILVPLDGTRASAAALAETIELACRCRTEVVVLHVHENGGVPRFSDQLQHEEQAFGREFLRRYCPVPVEELRLELRIGDPRERIRLAIEETSADLVALGWCQSLAPGRARIVRDTLARGHVPVLLVPVAHAEQAHESPLSAQVA